MYLNGALLISSGLSKPATLPITLERDFNPRSDFVEFLVEETNTNVFFGDTLTTCLVSIKIWIASVMSLVSNIDTGLPPLPRTCTKSNLKLQSKYTTLCVRVCLSVCV